MPKQMICKVFMLAHPHSLILYVSTFILLILSLFTSNIVIAASVDNQLEELIATITSSQTKAMTSCVLIPRQVKPMLLDWGVEIANEGITPVSTYGLETLVLPTQRDRKSIQANMSTISDGQSEILTLDFYGDNLLNFAVIDDAFRGDNKNKQSSKNTVIILSANTASNVLNKVVNSRGYPEASHAMYLQDDMVLLT